VKDETTEIFHETDILIRGNEPFLNYHGAGVVASLRGPGGQSHTIVERFQGYMNLSTLRKGDVLTLSLSRSRTEEITLIEKIKRLWRKK